MAEKTFVHAPVFSSNTGYGKQIQCFINHY